MKKILTIFICITTFISSAQTGYEIKVNLKNYKDTLAYLAYYQFDKTFIKDTCNVKSGQILFKGKEILPTGIYAVVSAQKAVLFNFFVDDYNQFLELKSDAAVDFAEDLVALNSERQNEFLDYIKYVGNQNAAFLQYEKEAVLNSKKDTLALREKRKMVDKEISNFEQKFLDENKETFIGDVINLKIEKVLEPVPNNASGKPDEKIAFKYYKKHYWDGVDLTDDATMRNPFFYNKLKKYFDQVVPMHPDSINVEINKILLQTKQESLMYKTLLSHFTYTYERSPIMGFDKVFVYLVDNYFKTGKASTLYSDPLVLQNIIKRADQLRPLLLGSIAPDLSMIKPQDYLKMREFGIEKAKTSEELTKLYYKHLPEINKLYVKLSEVKADYTVLIFWDVDCGHCQDEIPVLLKVYNEMIKQNIDIKVYSVYTQNDAEKYLKYITDHQLPWINVYDGARVNNTIQKYDVFSTPVIYVLDKNKTIRAKRIEAGKILQIIKALQSEG